MKTTAHTTVAERVGRGLGRVWLAIRRQEARVVQHMVHQGLSRGVAILIMWAVKLFALGVLLYATFWVGLLLIFFLTAAWVARHIDWPEENPKPEWRYGLLGFGLYDKDGFRIDPHDPNDEV